MKKTSFGTKEIIATLFAVALICAERALEVHMISEGIADPQIFEWIRLRALVVVIAAVFFGPISGAMSAVGGTLLINILFEESIIYPEIFALGLYGLFMGFYFGKLHYDPKHFSFRDFIDFNAIHILAGIFVGMFLIPMLQFLINDMDLYDGVISGTKRTIGTSVVVGLVCPFIMLIVKIVTGSGRDVRGT